eukprot:CAMPEP_0172608856 /NCGR_PEP_ID=MMETSP1068-20121228/28912_1 /TAXON_ID=35684 /ORGANISM="Pseudopedinella elastica, Strain CCMP716" /LENGTH=33 /DNA_ID= /DNA_START= /DNA_END= /DNA_ORIENTATION=
MATTSGALKGLSAAAWAARLGSPSPRAKATRAA